MRRPLAPATTWRSTYCCPCFVRCRAVGYSRSMFNDSTARRVAGTFRPRSMSARRRVGSSIGVTEVSAILLV